MWTLISRLLEKDPARRPQSASEAMRLLEDVGVAADEGGTVDVPLNLPVDLPSLTLNPSVQKAGLAPSVSAWPFAMSGTGEVAPRHQVPPPPPPPGPVPAFATGDPEPGASSGSDDERSTALGARHAGTPAPPPESSAKT